MHRLEQLPRLRILGVLCDEPLQRRSRRLAVAFALVRLGEAVERLPRVGGARRWEWGGDAAGGRRAK